MSEASKECNMSVNKIKSYALNKELIDNKYLFEFI